MIKQIFTLILIFISPVLNAQTVDTSSVNAFWDVTTTLKSGKEISNEQWVKFDSSTVYKRFVNKDDKFVINTTKELIQLIFDEAGANTSQIDTILNISLDEMKTNRRLLLKKLIADNYIDINENFTDLKSFSSSYNFEDIIDKSKLKLSSFLGHPVDSITNLKSIHFFFLSADAKDAEDAILVDLNLFYKLSENQRIELITHEYFHNYRRRLEDNNFNHKCDLNYMIDMIQNEGIADMIDKTEGYEKHYSNDRFDADLGKIMVELYNSAEKDLKQLHDLVIKYSQNEISEDIMVDGLLEIVKFNGHPIGFYMSNQIVNAGYRKQMIERFYDSFEFYKLYNMVAKENGLFQLSDEFMEFIFEPKN